MLCKTCRYKYLTPRIHRRRICDDFEVLSFYDYHEIEDLLLCKHYYIGHKIYSILGQIALQSFATALNLHSAVIPIDDKIDSYYSHTAILAQKMKTKTLKPKYNKLIAQNSVRYAGMSLEFRKANPRNFLYKGKKEDIILVDDIVTTGFTMKEAYEVCKKTGASPLFGVVLADAKS